MDLKEKILSKYETYVKMKQPHNTTPIFLKENVLEAMEEYKVELLKEWSGGKLANSENGKLPITHVSNSTEKECQIIVNCDHLDYYGEDACKICKYYC